MIPILKKDKLIIGSAGKPHEDAITLDIDKEHHPDVVHDLSAEPYPFEDNAFKEIVAHHVLEHLSDISVAMKELHRICMPKGLIYIEVPHRVSWCAMDPFHKSIFGYFSFDGFIEGNLTWMTGKKYKCIKKEITFHKYHRMFFLSKIFNKFPLVYERFYCYIFPAEHFKIWLSPVK